MEEATGTPTTSTTAGVGSETATVTTTIKPGYQTTEFWLTLLAMLMSMAYASGLIGETSAGYKWLTLIAGVLTSLGYTVTRGAVKKAAA